MNLWERRRSEMKPIVGSLDKLRGGLLVPRYSDQTAYHEAGHAYAYWLIGVPIQKAQVTRRGQLTLRAKNGEAVKAAGLVEPLRFPLIRSKCRVRFSDSRHRNEFLEIMFVSLSGPLNSSFYLCRPLEFCLSAGGDCDQIKIDRCREDLGMGDARLTRMVKNSKIILNSRLSRKAMWDISAKLAHNGSLTGRQIDQICSRVYRNYDDQRRLLHLCCRI